nr:YnfF [Bacillus subtilis]
MMSSVKKTICVLLVCFTMMSVMLLGPGVTEVSAASDAKVNISADRQVIRGFGGMNHPAWIGDLTAAQRETAFGNGQNQLGFSVLRIHVDENRNNWYKEVETAKSAIKHGAIVFASPWNPPNDMVETFNHNGDTSAKRLRYDKYAAYAQHLNDFVNFMKSNGVNLYAISMQNEPDYAHEWTWWTPQEILRFMRENAGSINARVIAPESFQYLKNISDPILNDPQALRNMDILGTHLYGTQVSQFPYPLFKQKGGGKELWMTEVYYPNSDNNSADRWPEALGVSEHIHHSMVEGDFQAYVWWYIRRSYGPMKEDGMISKRGYNMAHFSKFVRPGYVRIDATKNPEPNVYVSAYKGDNKVVIVAINKNNTGVNQNFVLQNGTLRKYPDGSRAAAAIFSLERISK